MANTPTPVATPTTTQSSTPAASTLTTPGAGYAAPSGSATAKAVAAMSAQAQAQSTQASAPAPTPTLSNNPAVQGPTDPRFANPNTTQDTSSGLASGSSAGSQKWDSTQNKWVATGASNSYIANKPSTILNQSSTSAVNNIQNPTNTSGVVTTKGYGADTNTLGNTINSAMVPDVGSVYDSSTGLWVATNTPNGLALWKKDYGIPQTNASDTAATIIGDSTDTSSMSAAEQATLTGVQAELARIKSMIDDPTTDAEAQLLQSQKDMLQTFQTQDLATIHQQAQDLYDTRVADNAKIEGQMRVFAANAGLSTTTSSQMLALSSDTIAANNKALLQIRQAEQQSVEEANKNFINGDYQLSAEQLQLADTRRQNYLDLLSTQSNLISNAKQLAMQTTQFNESMLQSKEQDLGYYAKAGADWSAIPDSVKQGLAEYGMDETAGKMFYTGLRNDAVAKTADDYNTNTSNFYKAAAAIPEGSDATLYRPNADGTFSKIDVGGGGILYEGGQQYKLVYPDNDKTKTPIKINLGSYTPDQTVSTDPFTGNTTVTSVAPDGTATSTTVVATNGNPKTYTALAGAQNTATSTGNTANYDTASDLVNQYPNVPSTHTPGTPRQAGESLTEYTNNPGAITYAYANSPDKQTGIIAALKANGINVKAGPRDANGNVVAMFDSVTDGYKARAILMTTPTYSSLDLAHAMGTYSGTKDKNGENVNYANYVSGRTGIPVTGVTMGDLDAQQRMDLAQAQYEWESGHHVKGQMSQYADGPQVPTDNKAAWKINAPEGTDMKTGIKSGVVKSVTQTGEYADGGKMYSVSVLDTATNTVRTINGLKNTNLTVGMGWDDTSPEPVAGTSGAGGTTLAVTHPDGSAVMPNNTNGTPLSDAVASNPNAWGQFSVDPSTLSGSTDPTYKAAATAFTNTVTQLSKGNITIEQALQKIKSNPILAKITPGTYMDYLKGEAETGATAKNKANLSNQRVQASLNNMNNRSINQVLAQNMYSKDATITAYLTAAPIIDRLNAASKQTGPVSDQDVLDAITAVDTMGGRPTEQQIKTITEGMSWMDTLKVLQQKGGSGGVISPAVKKQMIDLATSVFNNYKTGYQQRIAYYNNLLKNKGYGDNVLGDVTTAANALSAINDPNNPSNPNSTVDLTSSIPVGGTYTDPDTGVTYTLSN